MFGSIANQTSLNVMERGQPMPRVHNNVACALLLSSSANTSAPLRTGAEQFEGSHGLSLPWSQFYRPTAALELASRVAGKLHDAQNRRRPSPVPLPRWLVVKNGSRQRPT